MVVLLLLSRRRIVLVVGLVLVFLRMFPSLLIVIREEREREKSGKADADYEQSMASLPKHRPNPSRCQSMEYLLPRRNIIREHVHNNPKLGLVNLRHNAQQYKLQEHRLHEPKRQVLRPRQSSHERHRNTTECRGNSDCPAQRNGSHLVAGFVDLYCYCGGV